MRKKIDHLEIFAKIEYNQAALFEEYGENTICIPELSKWDYAIPEMYTNYQDGFLMPDCEAYKGMPIFDHPVFGTLYLRWDVPYYALKEGEREKYLCFDRHGKKYTVIIQKCPRPADGNPSYFRFLPKVKAYRPKRRKEITK